MTTAARPTYEPARGGSGKGEGDLSALSKQYSSRDLPAHTKLKYRQEGQSSSAEVRNRDFRKDLEEREKSSRDKRGRGEADKASSSTSASNSKRPRIDQLPAANLDADDPLDDDEEDEEEDNDSGDDEAELMAELQKIKKERAAEMARKEAEKKAEEERIRMENIIKGNPLMQSVGDKPADFKVKRRWDDDVVFKNCARGEVDRKERRFINDTLRSDFHKKFMEKYIK
jgi:protein CWC15